MSDKHTPIPMYQTIMNDLIASIKNDNFSFDEPFCTEKQLSEQYDVSRITAKRAITELEHQGVLFRKRGVGSFVSNNAKSILEQTPVVQTDSKTVSLLLPFDIARGGYFDTIEIINHSLNQKGYFTSLYISASSSKKDKKTLSLLLSQNISALVYYPLRDQMHMNYVNEFVMKGIPVIIIDKSTDCPYVHNIVSDNFEGGRLLTEHLISLGHKKIGFLTVVPIEEVSSVRNRFGGYLHQLRIAGIPASPEYVVCSPHNPDISDLQNNPQHPMVSIVKDLYDSGVTAIISENDYVAYSIKLCCSHLGLRVPEDISICGFDDNPLSKEQEITTIRQNFSLIGEHISRVLSESLEDPSLPAKAITVPIELVVRASTSKI